MRTSGHDHHRRRRRLAAGVGAAALAVTGLSTIGASTPAVAAECNGQWQRTDGAWPDGFTPYEVDAVGPNAVYIAGTTYDDNGQKAAMTRWNGTRWTQTDVPGMAFAVGVDARTPTDAWFTGYDAEYRDVIQHWNGKDWKQAPFPRAILGEYGWINRLVPRGANDVWAFGQKPTSVGGSAVVVAHFDGTTWKAVPNNLADSAFGAPLDASMSPSGELWVIGEDVDQSTTARTPWAGKLVGNRVQRVEIPAVPGYLSTMPTNLTWRANGSMVISGWTGDEWSGRAYPYSASGTPGSWQLKAQQTPTANWTTPSATARIGSTVWSASNASLTDGFSVDYQWNAMETLAGGGWSAPQRLNAHGGERAIGMDGLGNGQGWMTTWDEYSGDSMTPHLWTICGTPTAAAADATAAPATATPPASSSKAPSAVRPAAPASAKSPAQAHRAAVEARRDGRSVGADGRVSGTPAARPSTSDRPVSGPAVDKLRATQRTTAATSYVAKPLCAPRDSRRLSCQSSVVATKSGTTTKAAVTTLPIGYGPQDYRAAYGLPGSGGKGRTIAIIGVYGYPGLEKDLATYRKQAGLKACTSASGCLTVVGEDGSSSTPPPVDPGWALEQALDVQSASATCPDCKILVVQANDAYDSNIAAANQTAGKRKPFVISASLGRMESRADVGMAGTFVPKGIPYVASSGDYGHGTSFPSTIPSVIGVGGTRLLESPGTARGWREDAWALGGGGCSSVQPKPVWEKRDPLCVNNKASAVDVSAVGDPATGAGVYFGDGIDGQPGGWYLVGGTSLSAPLTAGIIALRGATVSSATIWNGTTATLDIAGRHTNGWCAPARECTAVKGYDGATGWGVVRP